MYDVGPGSAVTPTIRFLDGNGSPILSGITGTMTLFGPASTTALSGPTSMVHKGDGAWGVTFAGTNTTALGDYRWTTSAISGTATLAAQSGIITVGIGDLWSLRELYTAVRQSLDDGFVGSTTGVGTGTLVVCSTFAYGSFNHWVSSEIFFFEPQSVTDANPVRVTIFDNTTGAFTTAPSITATISGQDFMIGNIEGRGWRHERVMEAITTACRRQRNLRVVSDQVSLTGTSNVFEYTMPGGWIHVDKVEYQPSPGLSDYWMPLPPAYINDIPHRGKFALRLPLPNNALRVTGRAIPQPPQGMNSLVHGDGATLRDDAVFELLMQRTEPEYRQRAAMMQQGVMRARGGNAMARF